MHLATSAGGYDHLGGSRLRSATGLVVLGVGLGAELTVVVVMALVVAARVLEGALG